MPSPDLCVSLPWLPGCLSSLFARDKNKLASPALAWGGGEGYSIVRRSANLDISLTSTTPPRSSTMHICHSNLVATTQAADEG